MTQVGSMHGLAENRLQIRENWRFSAILSFKRDLRKIEQKKIKK